MKTSDQLFRLIRSMTQSEKRYFMLHAGLHREQNDAQLLFRQMDVMEVYDETLLRKKLRGKPIASRLDVAKVQLYNSILRAMRLYHEGETVERKIKELLIDFSFLYDKGLNDQAQKRIEKAKVLAWKFEKFNFLPEILEREMNLIVPISTGDVLREIHERVEESKKVLNLMNNLNYYAAYAHLLAACNRVTSEAQQKKLLNEIRLAVQSPLYTDDARALSQRAKRLQSYGLSSWFHICNDPVSALPHHHRQIELMEAQPEHIRENFRAYISPLYNALICLYSLNRFDEAKKMIEKIRGIPELLSPKLRRSPDLRMRLLSRIVNVEFGIMLRQGSFDLKLLNRKEVADIIQWMDEAQDMIRSSELSLSLAVFYYGCGESRKALKALQPLLRKSPGMLRRNIAAQAFMLQLIIHFEKGNDSLVEYLVRVNKRPFEEQGILTAVEKTMIGWLSVPQKRDELQSRKTWSKFIRTLEKEISASSDHGVIDYLAWAESHLHGRTYAEMVRRQAAA